MSRTDTDTEFDFASTLKARSDQLNADDLVGGPITVQIVGSREGTDIQQPVVLRLSGGHQPWKPCLTMRRLLAIATGSTSTAAVVGRWVTLYRDPEVTFGKNKEGGVRMSHLSGLDRTVTARLAVSKGKKGTFSVAPLRTPDQRQQGAPTANLERVLEDAGLDLADFDEWARRQGKPTSADLTPEVKAKTAAWLTTNPAKLDEIRAVHDEAPDTDDTNTAREPGEE